MSSPSVKKLPFARKPMDGSVQLPGSKSITHRALIAASLAAGDSRLSGPLFCEDTIRTLDGLSRMGAKFGFEGETLVVSGRAGCLKPAEECLDLGLSGTSLRFLLSIAGLANGKSRITGRKTLLSRPLEPLVSALRSLGCGVTWIGEQDELEVEGGNFNGGEVELPGEISSQFISSLLLAGPFSRNGVTVRLTSKPVSKPYIDLTMKVMDDFGVETLESEKGFHVDGGQVYKPRDYLVEKDLSTAGYFLSAAALTRGRVSLEGVNFETKQGDVRFFDILQKMGCLVEAGKTGVTLVGRPLKAISLDMSDIPDLVPTLAILALFADGETVISGVSHLRHKESNRLEGLDQELRKIRAKVSVSYDGLVIQGGKNLLPAQLDPRHDHRLAMSFATLGLMVQGMRISDPECVNKSFPNFWNVWESIWPE